MIVAIDGSSSSGKSTLAKNIAKKIGYTYIDSGAMFRALTLFGIDNQTISSKRKTIQKHFLNSLEKIKLSFKYNPQSDNSEICLNNVNVECRIRSLEVSIMSSEIAKIKAVRQKLLHLQRTLGEKGDVVMDGRDIGTKIFPNADLKLFITASLEVRAQRRYHELLSRGESVKYAEVLKNIDYRDFEDSNRVIAPLKKASDAILIDNTHLSVDDQINLVQKIINDKMHKSK